MTTAQIIDPEAIENLRALSPDDGDQFLKEILNIFLEDTPSRIAELHKHRAASDSKSFTRAAHSIKGSSSNVGANELKGIAQKLEHHSRDQGIGDVDGQIQELEAAFDRAKTAINKLLGT